jgi:hypothetical protein
VGVVLITRNYKETSQKVNKKTREGKFKTGKKKWGKFEINAIE